ncbi:deoxyribonuclease IV [Planctomycetaceae bacterium AH-315-I19]|nr:deoxyribonuclease IV [Planctomycetaceae bacterium AH-315-I19]
MSNAIREAEGLGMDTVQVFTKNQRQWKFKPLDDEVRDEWLAELARVGWMGGRGRAVAHDSYLINLASPDDELWEKSIALMREEIGRCEALGIPHLVSHPGAHMGQGVQAGLKRIAKAYGRLFKETSGCSTGMCLENTAGGGTTLGRSFEELGDLKRFIHDSAGGHADGRVGFCLDTCHALAAGYDIASHENGDGTGKKRTRAVAEKLGSAMLDEFDALCGLENLRVVHLNDSIGARASFRDRHAHIGKGNVAIGAFAAIVNRPELSDVPMILETPKGESESGKAWDTINLGKLRRLVSAMPTQAS